MAKKLTKEDLELMSYNDIANILLKENNEQSTLELFSKIVEMLELPKSTLESKIGEFYTALTNDKRFILLESGNWDLRQNHKTSNIAVEEDLDDYDEEIEDYDDIELEKEPEETFIEDSDDDISDVTEEYKNLVIVDEDSLEEN
ncbi:MAG: DNA-directed RNA polymerase subunit delta [Bacilli bacterium]